MKLSERVHLINVALGLSKEVLFVVVQFALNFELMPHKTLKHQIANKYW